MRPDRIGGPTWSTRSGGIELTAACAAANGQDCAGSLAVPRATSAGGYASSLRKGTPGCTVSGHPAKPIGRRRCDWQRTRRLAVCAAAVTGLLGSACRRNLCPDGCTMPTENCSQYASVAVCSASPSSPLQPAVGLRRLSKPINAATLARSRVPCRAAIARSKPQTQLVPNASRQFVSARIKRAWRGVRVCRRGAAEADGRRGARRVGALP